MILGLLVAASGACFGLNYGANVVNYGGGGLLGGGNILSNILGNCQSDGDDRSMICDFAKFTGNRNSVIGKKGSIAGNRNTVTGDFNQITGNRNSVTGKYSKVTGNVNIVTGVGSKVKGNKNTVTGDNLEVNGDSNQVCGKKVVVKGHNNLVIGDQITDQGIDTKIQKVTNNGRLSCTSGEFEALRTGSKWTSKVDVIKSGSGNGLTVVQGGGGDGPGIHVVSSGGGRTYTVKRINGPKTIVTGNSGMNIVSGGRGHQSVVSSQANNSGNNVISGGRGYAVVASSRRGSNGRKKSVFSGNGSQNLKTNSKRRSSSGVNIGSGRVGRHNVVSTVRKIRKSRGRTNVRRRSGGKWKHRT